MTRRPTSRTPSEEPDPQVTSTPPQPEPAKQVGPPKAAKAAQDAAKAAESAGAAKTAKAARTAKAAKTPKATKTAKAAKSAKAAAPAPKASRKTAAAREPAAPAASAAVPQPRSASAAPKAPPEVAASPPRSPVPDTDRARLLAGTHHDPHSVLGAHLTAEGTVFRALRPYARSVAVVAGELRAELLDDGDGFFSAVVPLRAVPDDYRLHITYAEAELEIPDAYGFLPAVGELDLHLIGEGRHERLWDALGARPMTHQGVPGTRFTVWAPNAQGVRVVGDFNYWDGSGFPMRSLGGTGVWELFVPGLGAGELYKFQITRPDGGTTFRADPLARRTEAPPANSSVVDASHHEWGDEEWMRRRGDVPVHEAPFSV
ncbi:1,4-alpha-glucan branching enzyme, partial [Streptomyces aurantiacus]|uniref:GlgB N-terminal domain-containing protein n=1 Tax=Streptomyces aurantiacus TaxID=47760 RepID=UPI00336131A1